MLLLSIFFFSFSDKDSFAVAETNAMNDSFKKFYKIFALNHPASLSFAGEIVPMDINHVKERFDRELLVNTYWQSQTLLLIKRSARFLPQIEAILREEEVPEDFKYLAVIESGLTDVVSPAGAAGFWQILKTTAIENGLEINKEVDERYHLEKATKVACKYLKEAKLRFGSWTMAAASYNRGMTGMAKSIEKQRSSNYYNLKLNEETSRYVFRILAAKVILSNPSNYGFILGPEHFYPPYEVNKVEIKSSISDLSAFALENGINYNTLKILNPWLRDNTLSLSGNKTYYFDFPVKEQIRYFVAY